MQVPYALESDFLSVIKLNSETAQIRPLINLKSFEFSDIKSHSVAAVGSAFFVCKKIPKKVKKTIMEEKGNWWSMVFISSDV